MKNVIISRSATEVITQEASFLKYYGLSLRASKGFVVRPAYNQGDFSVVAASNLTNGNGWNYGTDNSLPRLLETYIRQGFVVYEFATWQELFAWLLDPTR